MRGVGPILVLVTLSLLPVTAKAWDPFRASNPHVDRGNALMAEDQPAEALEAYDRAARELPSEPGVHLNRGLALLSAGRLEEAQNALLLATEPSADTSLRADAYYNLGLLFYRQGDAAAAQQDHASAQTLFRQAADAFKRSLRARPGNRDAGWNLELALRRIEEQQEQQEQQDQQDQDQDEQEQGEDGQDGDGQDQRQEDDEQDQDRDDADQDPDQQDQQDSQDDPDGDDPQGQEDDPAQDGDEQEQDPQDDAPDPPPPEEGDRPLPRDAERILDALEGSEDNLWRHRARTRGAQERRRPAKDW
jgi:Ca-activated chloride channel homolog